ncbi:MULTISPECIES: hypothetical protein [Staphylococcus]|uniref:hypothetical protein n=1 Tax=Staphylococcus TaxID=1279 RepID=UPI0008532C57|nr:MULTISPECIES: hypothetical protein [Staphylococcus]OEK72542.1 hypothetical protein AST03_13330 [Staphylococcus equorum]OEK97707.1 hypothetical protein AST11_12270 [Staphylococcus saprophyticus]
MIEYTYYNEDEVLTLNKKDINKNKLLIKELYINYENLKGEIIFYEKSPVLIINGYAIARVENKIDEPQDLSFLQINNETILACIQK